MTFKADKNTSFSFDWNHAARNYGDFNVQNLSGANPTQPWEMPAFNLFDLGLVHKFKFADLDTRLTANLHNIFNTEYISDSRNGASYTDSEVYYGAGRTFNLGLKIKF